MFHEYTLISARTNVVGSHSQRMFMSLRHIFTNILLINARTNAISSQILVRICMIRAPDRTFRISRSAKDALLTVTSLLMEYLLLFGECF